MPTCTCKKNSKPTWAKPMVMFGTVYNNMEPNKESKKKIINYLAVIIKVGKF